VVRRGGPGKGHTRPTGPRCVCGKVIYKSRSGAKHAARMLHKSEKRPYRCQVTPLPDVWHLGELSAEVIAGDVTRDEAYEMAHTEVEARRLVGIRSNRGCETCGSAGYEFSHRRTRAIQDDHVWCPCNGVNSCHTCHAWLHAHPADAKVLGLMVSRFEPNPAGVPVRLKMGWVLLHCDGTVSHLRDDQVEVNDLGVPVIAA
jgi:hypothetical protein